MTKNQKIRSIVEHLLVLASNPKMLRRVLAGRTHDHQHWRFWAIIRSMPWAYRCLRHNRACCSLSAVLGKCASEFSKQVDDAFVELSVTKASGIPNALKRLAEVLNSMDKPEQHYRVEAGPDGLLFFPIR